MKKSNYYRVQILFGVYRIIPVITSCGHKFCKMEIEKYNNNSGKMNCPLCRTKIDFYKNDKQTQEIIKKCQFAVGGKPIDTETFIQCYQFFNKWSHCQKMNVPYTYFYDGDTTSDDESEYESENESEYESEYEGEIEYEDEYERQYDRQYFYLF